GRGCRTQRDRTRGELQQALLVRDERPDPRAGHARTRPPRRAARRRARPARRPALAGRLLVLPGNPHFRRNQPDPEEHHLRAGARPAQGAPAMTYTFTVEQEDMRRTARDVLARVCTPQHVRAAWAADADHDRSRWRQLAELGFLGVNAPVEHGGLGLDEAALIGVLEEAGY